MAITQFSLTTIILALSAVFSLLASRCAASNLLLSGSRLSSGESLTYIHRRTGKQYTLTMHSDCNLVLYDGRNSFWSTGTSGRRHCYLTLRSNGELAIYRARSLIPVWTTNAASAEGIYALVLRYDGSLRVYGPTVWSVAPSLSASWEKQNPIFSRPATTMESVLHTGDVARVGTTIASGDYALVMQDSCNLVLTNNRSGEILCETRNLNERSHGNCYATLSGRGQLKMGYVGGGEPFWVNGKMSSYGDYVLVIDADARLAIYGPSIWAGGKPGRVAATPARSSGLGPREVKVGFTCKKISKL